MLHKVSANELSKSTATVAGSIEVVLDHKARIVSASDEVKMLARDQAISAKGCLLHEYLDMRRLGSMRSLTDRPCNGLYALRSHDGVMYLKSVIEEKSTDQGCTLILKAPTLNSADRKDLFHRGIYHQNAAIALSKFVTHCSQIYGIPHIYIGRGQDTSKKIVEVFAARLHSEQVELGSEYAIEGTPCEAIYNQSKIVELFDDDLKRYDDAPILDATQSSYFLGIPVLDAQGHICCHISMLREQPFKDSSEIIALVDSLGAWLEAQCLRLEKDRELEDARNEYRDLFDNVYDGILHLDAEGRLVKANKAMYHFINPGDSLTPMDYVLEEDRHIILQLRKDVRSQGYVRNRRFRIKSSRLGIRMVEVSATARFTSDGKYDGMQEIVKDITEQEDSRQALVASEKHHQLIFNKSEVGLVYVREGLLSHVNPHTGSMLGWSPLDLVGRPAAELIAEEDQGKFALMVQSILTDKREVREIVRIKHAQGKVAHVICTLNTTSDVASDSPDWLMSLTDISDQVSAEDELRRSQSLYRSMVETSPAGIIRLDDNLDVEFMSNRVRVLHRLSLADRVTSFEELVHVDQREEIVGLLKSVTTDEVLPISFVSQGPEEKIFCQGAAKALFDRDGNKIGILLCYSDMTEVVQYEQSLQKSQARYRNIVKSSPSGIAIFSADLFMQYASPRTIEIFGYADIEEFDREIYAHIHPNDLDRLRLYLKRSAETGTVQQGRFRARHFTGHYFWLETYVSVRKDEDGVEEHLFILNDISKILEFERELEKEKSIYQSLIANSFDGIDILEFDQDDSFLSDGKILIRNEVMRKMLGLDSFSTIEEFPSSLMIGNCESGASKEDQIRVLQREKALSCAWRVEGSNKVHYLDGVLQIIAGEDANYIVRILRDVTAQRESSHIIERQMQDLNLQNEELERYIESNLQLENFAYIASHDLKAPARSIGSFADLLGRTVREKLSDRENQFLSIILNSSKHMLALIDDLLTYSKVNTETSDFASVAPHTLINEVTQDLQNAIVQSGAVLHIGEMPPSIYGDRTKLRKLFTNLMTNSLKFQTDGNTPKIKISCEDNLHEWCFTFSDNGIGIDEKYADKVFLLFQKLHSSDKFDGSGMGLAICKKIIDQHNGRIWVDTALELGASISFTIPKSQK